MYLDDQSPRHCSYLSCWDSFDLHLKCIFHLLHLHLLGGLLCAECRFYKYIKVIPLMQKHGQIQVNSALGKASLSLQKEAI